MEIELFLLYSGELLKNKNIEEEGVQRLYLAHPLFFPIPTISPTDPLPPYNSGGKP